MRRVLHLRFTVISLIAFCWTLVPIGRAQPFVPLEHFPEQGWLFVQVDDVGTLDEQLVRTLPGRILSHRDVGAACAVLLEQLGPKLGELSDEISADLGMRPSALAELFGGDVALMVHALSASGQAEVALALETRGRGAEQLAWIARQFAGAEVAEGEHDVRLVGTLEATILRGGPVPAFAAELGTHLVLASSTNLLAEIHGRFSSVGEPGVNALHAGMQAELEVTDRRLLLELNVPALMGLAVPAATMAGDPAEVGEALRLSGAGLITSLGVALGFDDGGVEHAIHLGLAPGGDGLMAALREGLRPIGDVDDALERIPAAALELGAVRVATGTATRAFERALGDETLDVDHDLIAMLRELPELGLFYFQVRPPAGGLMAETLYLVRTSEWQPYRQVVAASFAEDGLQFMTREVGPAGARRVLESIDYMEGVASRDEGTVQGLLQRLGGEPPSISELGELADSIPVFSRDMAVCDLGDGWTVFSNAPQSIQRYLHHYAGEPTAAQSPEFVRLVRTHLVGTSGGAVFRTGQPLLWTYNTLIQLGGVVPGVLAELGVDVGRLPPAEAFLDDAHPGYWSIGSSEHGLTISGHRAEGASTVVGGIVVLGAFAALAGRTTHEQLGEALDAMTRARLDVLRLAIDDYRRHHGHVPESLEALLEPSDLNAGEPYAEHEDLWDPWEHPFHYVTDSAFDYQLQSWGADGEPGGAGLDADIVLTGVDR